jgi:hypothetical protein
MQSRDKERAAQARRRNGATATAEEESNYNRASQRGESINTGTQQDLDELGDQLGDNWSDYVQFRALQRMMENLKTGKRGEDLQQFVTALKYGVTRAIASTRVEIGQELDPKYLPQSNDEPTQTLTESSPWDQETTIEAQSEESE